jgi:hypothetical protein
VTNHFTHHAATAALVAAGFWIMSAVSGLWGKGSLLTDWTDLDYAIWTALTAVAVLATIVVVVGVLLREDGRHGALKIAGIGLAVIGGALLIVGTWAWAATSPVLAAAGLVVALRLRATGLGAPTDWLLAAAWPIGIGTLILLEELKVGPTDSYGDHEIASLTGFTLAATLFAIGLAGLGARLRNEKSIDPIDITHHDA